MFGKNKNKGKQTNNFKSPPKRKSKSNPKSIKQTICCVNKSEEKKMERQKGTSESDLCYKCLDEARHLLNYSPKSLFLRRIKQRLESLQNNPLNKNDSLVAPDDLKCVATANSEFTLEEHKPFLKIENDIINGELRQETIMKSVSEPTSVHQKQTYHKCVKIGKSREKLKQENKKISLKTSCHPNKNCFHLKSNDSVKSTDVASFKKCSGKVTRARTNGTHMTVKCHCKKQVGGLCCCEAQDMCFMESCLGIKSNPVRPFTQETSVQVPEQLTAQTAPKAWAKTEPEQQTQRCSISYDILSELADNRRDKLSADPCLEDLETLSHFRQKHWFDCHAHPHSATSLCNIRQMKLEIPGEEFMETPSDPCVRAYRLDRRLFPQAAWEVHGVGCCAGPRGACAGPGPPALPPSQRRVVTLPSLPPRFSNASPDTFKLPPGVRVCPASHLMVCDPSPPPSPPRTRPPPPSPRTRSPHAAARRPSSAKSPRRAFKPLPCNSLALRFQKGVSR